MDANELSDEMKAKLLECKNPAEILQLAATEGYELSDEQLDGVAGGWDDGCSGYCTDFCAQHNAPGVC